MSDEVNHPKHYNSHPSGVAAIDICEAMSFSLGNAVKYLWRCAHKHDSPLQDLQKALWYIKREIAYSKRLWGDDDSVSKIAPSVALLRGSDFAEEFEKVDKNMLLDADLCVQVLNHEKGNIAVVLANLFLYHFDFDHTRLHTARDYLQLEIYNAN